MKATSSPGGQQLAGCAPLQRRIANISGYRLRRHPRTAAALFVTGAMLASAPS
jgi:hypothetical protein